MTPYSFHDFCPKRWCHYRPFDPGLPLESLRHVPGPHRHLEPKNMGPQPDGLRVFPKVTMETER